ncbi:MAG: hypothetical protein KGL12_15610 [Rhodospirillales bacterium]|nr:hypothetical protein [Rhodospirillales bacterium]
MARRASKAAGAAAVSAAGGGQKLIWAQGLACGTLVALVPGIALLLGVLLAPALVALALDQEAGKPVARSVFLCALAGGVGPVRALWAAGHGVDTALVLLTGLGPVGLAWAAAACGWLAAEVLPLGLRLMLEGLARARLARLRAAQDRYREEWGAGASTTDAVKHRPAGDGPAGAG